MDDERKLKLTKAQNWFAWAGVVSLLGMGIVYFPVSNATTWNLSTDIVMLFCVLGGVMQLLAGLLALRGFWYLLKK